MPDSRQLIIKDANFTGTSVVYVMSRDQRAQDNHALLAAQAFAKEQDAPLYVLFVLRKIGIRSREHYTFMLEGLDAVAQSLSTYNIPFILRHGDPVKEIDSFNKEINAGALYFDFSPLKGARALIKNVAKGFNGPVTVVDTHNIIPAWVVSDKQEFAARTMRTKVFKKLDHYLASPAKLEKQAKTTEKVQSLTLKEALKIIDSMPLAGFKNGFESGEIAAHEALEYFTETDLKNYAKNRNNIAVDAQSNLSPYLHYGQISSLRIALDVIDAANEPPLLVQMPKMAEHSDVPSKSDGMNVLLEEMIIRKELADNFCFYNAHYLSLNGAPDWAKKSLSEHADDKRDFTYTAEEWEAATTHDEIWNASQNELKKTGKIHGYMRMYWAKKILEWSASPEEAIKTAIYLNDKYSIDGGDPNGYVGILWSIAGLHDRPWFEHHVYGKVRYMNDGGLRRKFKVDDYILRVNTQ